ncbi:POTRA domain-containing protein [Pseudoalteromonas sp. T1lg75]|uniref:POTRA domain-containing protein n=1 Tax=Pseudoalteromonas sp. T1lg75 TaxID=2077102 RepID=UPI00131A0A1C|nr:POTRA domain-containing protein [Pseudoalteromonas sp. T1lg75]
MKRLVVTLGILVAAQGQALAQCSGEHLENDTDQLLSRQLADKQPLPEADGTRQIGHIHFIQNNIFNTDLPSEDNWLFHLANKMHIMTEPQVLKNILLFGEGDPYDPELLKESERLLRQQGYLYDAQISASERCEEYIDVVITTRELWTLLPEISFSRSGGENRSTFGFRDGNFLGWGKHLSLVRTNDDDRSGYEFTYADPNVFGSRYKGRLEYADNSDGERHWLALSYPFYSLDTPYSYGFANGSNRRDEKLYNKGKTISEFSQDTSISEVFFGLARRPAEHWTQRIRLGYRYQNERFYELPETYLPIATERTLSYPYIDISWLEDDFVKVHNIDTISRTEDLNLGWQIHAQFGYSPSTLSDDASRYILKLNVHRSHYISQRSLWRWSLGIDGTIREQDFEAENLFFGAHAEYLYNSDDAQSWYVKGQVDAAEGLTADQQLPLGGDTGLRGYPHHYQLGDRRALFSIEKRYYWQYNLWQLFRVGGALFYDAGQAWFHDNQENAHFRHNLGFGLRLAPSRANAGAVIHLDVARPINRSDDVDPLQWLVSVKKSF